MDQLDKDYPISLDGEGYTESIWIKTVYNALRISFRILK